MIDFNLTIYEILIKTLEVNGYKFYTVKDCFLNNNICSKENVFIMRHDVDRLPQNALQMAKLENNLGIESTYYFRMVPCSFDEPIIKKIIDLGHEIGYHYENLSECNGDYGKAIIDFESNLNEFRKLYPVKTICMHGSPLSKWDNRDLWNKYDYREFGIIAEPYFDIDFNVVSYITDTGRRWDGEKTSIRDKVKRGKFNNGIQFHSTNDVINSVLDNTFPKEVMMTVHPQRWTNNPVLWTKELIMQNLKNSGKYFLAKMRT